MLEELEKDLDGEAEHVRRRRWEGGARRSQKPGTEGELPDRTYSTRHKSGYSVANGHPAVPEIRMCLYFFPSPFRCPKIVSSVILPSSPTPIPFFSLSNTKLFLGLFWTK